MAEEKKVVNMEFAMAQCMDDLAFFKELVTEMLGEADAKVAEIDKAIESKDYPSVQSVAHYIKGAAANLGLDALFHVCKELDAIGKELKGGDAKNVDQLKPLAKKLKEEFTRLTDHMKTLE